MRKVGLVGFSAILYVFLVGMCNIGGPLSVQVPEPETNYAATVVDQSDISTPLEKFSFRGQTFISGKMGDADVSVTFDKIESINFALRDDTLTAEVKLKNGKAIPVVMDKETVCYGRFEYGDFRIPVKSIRSITLHGEVAGRKSHD